MEKSLFDNGFFEFVYSEKEYSIDGKKKTVKRNFVRRPPGIRALIVNKKDNKILLSKEYRYELENWDYRLPGGKVFENLADYKQALKEDNVLNQVEKTVPKEVEEEVGLIVKNPHLLKISKAGAGVEWDLYYYEITEYEVDSTGPKLEEDEVIEGYVWKSFDEIIDMCINKKIQEERTTAILLTYILKSKGLDRK